jgi:hypothetical protein
VVKWPGAHENFVTNQHFALVGTDLEFLGQNPCDFSLITGGSITVTGKVLEIPYKLEPGSCDLETSLAGRRLGLLFDHPLPTGGSKPSILESHRQRDQQGNFLGWLPHLHEPVHLFLARRTSPW